MEYMDTATLTRELGTDENRVYRAYRLALRNLRGGHAGARRQRAREIVTARYKLSHRELKNIVAAGDSAAGVTHEHTPQYLVELEYQAAAEKVEAFFADLTGCPVCRDKNAGEVRVRPNPPETEGAVPEPMYSCFKCYRDHNWSWCGECRLWHAAGDTVRKGPSDECREEDGCCV